jgi:hypothetical protein
MSETKLTINAIKSNKGYYVSSPNAQGGYYGHNALTDYLFDGVTPNPSFHEDWVIIPNIPVKISRMVEQPNTNYRFILIDDSLKSDKIPLELKREEAGEFIDDCESNSHFVWKDEYAMYRSLYTEISDPQPDLEVVSEFEFNVLFDVGEIIPPSEFKYPVNKRWYDHELHPDFVEKSNIVHQELDKIIFPSILIHETPCKLSSEDTYKIVREHIKQHINLKVARITSDYDFCFEVAKIIPLANPHNWTYNDNAGTRRLKRMVTKLVSTKEIKCFEMTNDNNNYKGYTPIEGFEGKNEVDLKLQIDNYLGELMAYINEPLKECSHCNGNGVLFNGDIEPVTAKHEEK